ncbi:MAG: protein BatD [Nitrospinae bacterium]|nr:protein BatD [Nitrospinota bacterium]
MIFYNFDSDNAKYRIAKTRPITLNIKPSSAKEKLNLVQPSQQKSPILKPEIETLGTDILPIYTELDKFQSNGPHSFTFLGIGFGSPVVLFIISSLLMKRHNRMKYDVAYYRSRNAYKNASQRFKKVSERSDSKEFARELSEIFREYIGDKLNLQGKAITAEEMQVRLKESNYEPQAEEIRKLLEKLETLQYAPMTQGSTKQLLGESENLIKILEKKS